MALGHLFGRLAVLVLYGGQELAQPTSRPKVGEQGRGKGEGKRGGGGSGKAEQFTGRGRAKKVGVKGVDGWVNG